ncbi:unnamed protein product [Gadus morhua 'NCC']
MLAPVMLVHVMLAPVMLAPVKLAPVKLAPVMLAPVKLAPVMLGPVMLGPVMLEHVMLAPVMLVHLIEVSATWQRSSYTSTAVTSDPYPSGTSGQPGDPYCTDLNMTPSSRHRSYILFLCLHKHPLDPVTACPEYQLPNA